MSDKTAYEIYYANLEANGVPLMAFPCPHCGSTLKTAKNDTQSEWDTMSFCPYCDKSFIKISPINGAPIQTRVLGDRKTNGAKTEVLVDAEEVLTAAHIGLSKGLVVNLGSGRVEADVFVGDGLFVLVAEDCPAPNTYIATNNETNSSGVGQTEAFRGCLLTVIQCNESLDPSIIMVTDDNDEVVALMYFENYLEDPREFKVFMDFEQDGLDLINELIASMDL